MNEKILAGLTALMIAGSAGAGSAQASSFVKAETFANTDGVLEEIKFGGSIGDDYKLKLFGRDRMLTSYQGDTSNFLLLELGLGKKDVPIKIFGQTKFSGSDLSYHLGLGYSATMADKMKLYVALDTSVNSNPTGQFLVAASYQAENGLNFEAENITWLRSDSLSGRCIIHAGFRPTDYLNIGAAGEVDYSLGSKPQGRIGGFVRLELK